MGLAAEARIVAPFGFAVGIGGGTPAGAAAAAERLLAQGVTALVSFGFAGGLDPALAAGALVIPAEVVCEGEVFRADALVAERFGGLTGHRLVAGSVIVGAVAAKRALHDLTRAHAIDLESGSVARVAAAWGVPFVAVRAISDPAWGSLPPAALVAVDRQGRVGLLGVVGSLLRQPSQLPALLRLAVDARRARRALVGVLRLAAAAPGRLA